MAGGNWSPGSSQPSGQQPLTGASVEGGDIRLEIVESCHRCTRAFCFVPHRKWFQTLGLIALSNGSGSAQFSAIQFSNGGWVQVHALQFLNRTEDFHELGVNWKEAQSSRHISSQTTWTASTARMVVFRSHFVACLGPPACACKFRLHVRARRSAVSRFTGLNFENRAHENHALWPVKAPCWHFEYSKSNELFEQTWC